MLLTIAMATWNRAPLLRRVLAGVVGLRVPADVQVEAIICDNNSTDQTAVVIDQAIAGIPAGGPVTMRRLHEPRQGKSLSLNRILAEARGQWVLFLDDDVLVDAGLIEGYLAGMSRHPQAVCLGGEIRPWVAKKGGEEQGGRGGVEVGLGGGSVELQGIRGGVEAAKIDDLTPAARWLVTHYPACFGALPVVEDTPMVPPGVSAWGANMMLRRDLIPASGFDPARGMSGGVRIAGEDVAMVEAMLERGEGWLVCNAGVGHYLPPERTGVRWFLKWQRGLGVSWRLHRAPPEPGRFGVAWWAWMELFRRVLRVFPAWRPRPTVVYYDRLRDVAQWWGYLRG